MEHRAECASGDLAFLFPDVDSFGGDDPTREEAVLLFATPGRGADVVVASDCFYEAWVCPSDGGWSERTTGECAGLGGARCCAGEAYSQTWHVPEGSHLVLRLHWLNPRTGRKLFGQDANVLYRSVFERSFLAVAAGSEKGWSCWVDTGFACGVKMSTQLARQNVLGRRALRLLPLREVGDRGWKIVPLPVHPLRLVDVEPMQVAACIAAGGERSRPRSRGGRGRGMARGGGVSAQKPPPKPAPTARSSHPAPGEDVLAFARSSKWMVRTYDLGAIAHHRFALTSISPASASAVMCYSEVADWATAWGTSNREKVRMADALVGGPGAPIGVRGCRYLHLLLPRGATATVRVQRAEYPFAWRETPGPSHLLDACRANLVACVDGNVVDTCWRERVLWVGDLRMAAKALRRLADNAEVVAFSLRLVADSYEPTDTAMVQGAWPCGTPSFRLEMPTYHLAFCLASLEHDPTLEFDERVQRVVRESVQEWRRRYVSGGLLRGLPGWHFVDWDPEDGSVVARTGGKKAKLASPAHCVSNVWWAEVCEALGCDSGIDRGAFEKTFRTPTGYRMWENGSPEGGTLHATATVLASGTLGGEEGHGLDYLRARVADGTVARRVTAYYGYFVAKALTRHDRAEGKAFVENFYGTITRAHGTIYEKTTPTASLAHMVGRLAWPARTLSNQYDACLAAVGGSSAQLVVRIPDDPGRGEWVFSNASDGATVGTIRYHPETGTLVLRNRGRMSTRNLLQGGSDASKHSKPAGSETAGQYGEGMKLAFLALARCGVRCHVQMEGRRWVFGLERDPLYEDERCLFVEFRDEPGEPGWIEIVLEGVDEADWRAARRRLLLLTDVDPRPCACDPPSAFGAMLLAPEYADQVYAKNIFVTATPAGWRQEVGYNIRDIALDRDRMAFRDPEQFILLSSHIAADTLNGCGPERAKELVERLYPTIGYTQLRMLFTWLKDEVVQLFWDRFRQLHPGKQPTNYYQAKDAKGRDEYAIALRLPTLYVSVDCYLLQILRRSQHFRSPHDWLAEAVLRPRVQYVPDSPEARQLARAAEWMRANPALGLRDVVVLTDDPHHKSVVCVVDRVLYLPKDVLDAEISIVREWVAADEALLCALRAIAPRCSAPIFSISA